MYILGIVIPTCQAGWGKMINKYYLKYPILHDVGKMTNLKIPLYA